MDILIIDDEVRRMRATIDMLRADNFTVEQIDSPTEALKKFRNDPQLCKVIILDIMMPPDGEFDVPESKYGLRTGILLLERLKRIPSFSIPIIIFTANQAIEKELKENTASFLHKPTPYEKLKSTIENLVERK